jgi:hypothetical protein
MTKPLWYAVGDPRCVRQARANGNGGVYEGACVQDSICYSRHLGQNKMQLHTPFNQCYLGGGIRTIMGIYLGLQNTY